MSNWWKELSRRERLLICLMFVVASVLFFSLAVVRPLVTYRDSANTNLQTALNTSVWVDRAVVAAATSDNTVQSTDNLRGVITSSAQQAGLRWINIRTSQDDTTLTISFAGVSTGALLGWLVDLQEKRNIFVREARIGDSRTGDGLEATITFSQGA